jgi:hypothetical protein
MKRYSPLLLILVLLGVLAISQAAPAATPAAAPASPQPSLHEAEEAEGEEELEVEECEAGSEFESEEELEEEGFEVEEECDEEEGENGKNGFVTAPAACRVRRAESSITTLPGSDKVLLTLRYLTYSPTTVTLGLKLKDHKGTVTIEHTTRHMGAKGVLHLTAKLDDAVMERAAKAQEFDVSLRAPGTPGYCGELLEQDLRSKHPVGKARVYTESVKG